VDAYALNLSVAIARGGGSAASVTTVAADLASSSGADASRQRAASDGGSYSSSGSRVAAAPSAAVAQARQVRTGLSGGASVRERRLGVPFAPLARRHLAAAAPSELAGSSSGGGGGGADGAARVALRRARGGRGRTGSSDGADGLGGASGGSGHSGGVAVAAGVAEDWGEPAFEALDLVGGQQDRSGQPGRVRFGSGDSDSNQTAAAHGCDHSGDQSLDGEDVAFGADGLPVAPSRVGRGYGADADELGAHLFAVHGKLLFSCKHWDCSFKVGQAHLCPRAPFPL
jgi:hypothetical protein